MGEAKLKKIQKLEDENLARILCRGSLHPLSTGCPTCKNGECTMWSEFLHEARHLKAHL